MDMRALKEQIDKLDPQAHKALRDALTAEYRRLAGEKGGEKPQGQAVSDPFAEMFKKAVDELSRRYIEGRLTISESTILTFIRKRTRQRTG